MTAVQTNLFHAEPTIRDLYDAWKVDNCALIRAFFKWADYAASHGKRFGAKMIWEQIRWQEYIVSNGDLWKCNNNYDLLSQKAHGFSRGSSHVSFLIRDWIKARPQWAHLVETRKLRSEDF